jgi:hypothetical protein
MSSKSNIQQLLKNNIYLGGLYRRNLILKMRDCIKIVAKNVKN